MMKKMMIMAMMCFSSRWRHIQDLHIQSQSSVESALPEVSFDGAAPINSTSTLVHPPLCPLKPDPLQQQHAVRSAPAVDLVVWSSDPVGLSRSSVYMALVPHQLQDSFVEQIKPSNLMFCCCC